MTKEKFLDYERIRRSGITNMFIVKNVLAASTAGLTDKDCFDIMDNYNKYKKEYLEDGQTIPENQKVNPG